MPTPAVVARLDDVTVRHAATQRSRHSTAPDVLALDGVSLEVARGEILGVVGESGAGKSTMLRLLDGIEHPTSGRVLVEDTDLATLSARRLDAMRHRIGMVFQSFNLLSNRTARQNVELPLRLQRRRDPARVDELLDFVGLADHASRYPAQLSGGQQQRVAIARALATRPSLLLCDEPTSALDARTTDDILRVLDAARRELDTSVVLVTHELEAVKAIGDRAAVLEAGRLVDVLPVARTVREASSTYADEARRRLAS